MSRSQQQGLPRQELNLADLAGKRVGVEGNWFVKVVRSHLKRYDPFWALHGPVTPAIKIITAKFLKKLESQNITPVFVFDGLYTRRQAHPAVLLHRMTNQVTDVKKQVRELEPLDEDAICYISRLLVSLGVEVITAPYLAWAQLAYFAHTPADGSKPFVADIFGALDVLAVGCVKRVITEIGNLDDNNAKLSAFTAHSPDHALKYITQPTKIAESPHWSWLQHSSPEEDEQHVKSTLAFCPVLCFDGTLQSVCKVTANEPQPAILRQYFYNDLGSKSPLLYFLLTAGIVSPQLLTVIAAEQFIDDPPFIFSNQYRTTLERILPLRTQIVFQLVQELERYLRGFEQIRKLNWERPHDEQPTLPIQRPPKIALDEWENIDPSPARPYDFKSVLTFSSQARPVEEGVVEPPVTYKTSEQALGAVLLKSLDLLGYFTHAAHSTNETEESSMSIFAQALDQAGDYGSECVLLIELTRTRSLHDEAVVPHIKSTYLPRRAADGARYAARIMSLLRLDSGRVEDDAITISSDLLAFNDIARSFQRSLRLLSEAIAATQVLNHTAVYPLKESRDFSARLPFAVPLTIHAGLILEYMLTSPEYASLHVNSRNQHLKDKFPHMADMPKALRAMKTFWMCAMHVVCKLLEDEEAEEDFYQKGAELVQRAHALVTGAFQGVLQMPALPEIVPPQIA